MTQETYKQAKMLEERIVHIGRLIELLSQIDYELDPPTRMTSYDILRNSGGQVNLNEGEVEFLKKALSEEMNRLIQEFDNL